MNAKRRRGMGGDPLADLYDTGNAGGSTAPKPKPEPTPAKRDKVRFTVLVDADLVDRARTAVMHRAGHPHLETLSTLVGRAIAAELQRLEDDHGGPFDPVDGADLRRLPNRRA